MFFRKTVLIFFATAAAFIPVLGQNRGAGIPSGNRGGHVVQPSQKKDTVERQGSAWTLTYPLGSHEKSTIDTLTYNYQRNAVPSMQTDAFLTTGNLGGEGESLILFEREPATPFFFEQTLLPWMSTFKKQKFYNVYVPMTLVSYNFGGNRDSGQDRLKGVFAGNVNRRIGIGAHLDYIYSKGSYANQAVKDYIYGFSGYYLGDRYEMQAFFNQNNMLNKENGGIEDDLYITDPAVLQGGVSKIEAKSIPTRLNNAHTRLHSGEFYMNHAYKVGYWQDQVVNDTLTRQIYIPVVKFIYTLDYRKARHNFINENSQEAADFWQHTYLNPEKTKDRTSYWSLSNTLGISMMEGFRKWVKFGLSAYATYEIRKYRQTSLSALDNNPDNPEELKKIGLTPLPENFYCPEKASQNLLWIGGRLDKQKGKYLRYSADARFGIIGDVAADIDLRGRIETSLPLFGDTVAVNATGIFRNEAPSYLLNHYVSNHFVWDNDFGKTRTFRVQGEIEIPWTKTRLSVGFQNMQNYIYFNSESMPQQHGGSIHVFSASLDQKLQFGIWNWNNTVHYQASSKKEVLPLPSLSIYSNMFLDFRAFRVLHMQIGVDCDYYTRYNAMLYQPATMSFHVQQGKQVGNYAFCNAYVTCRLYKVRFFVMWSHFNQNWFGREYFAMPGYPLNPRRLQLGLSVDFAN